MPSIWEKFRDDTAEEMTMHLDPNFDDLLADRFGARVRRSYQLYKQNLAHRQATIGQAKLKVQHLLDLFKSGQPVEVAGSHEKLIGKVYEIVQEMDDTADIQLVMKKHLVQSKPQGVSTGASHAKSISATAVSVEVGDGGDGGSTPDDAHSNQYKRKAPQSGAGGIFNVNDAVAGSASKYCGNETTNSTTKRKRTSTEETPNKPKLEKRAHVTDTICIAGSLHVVSDDFSDELLNPKHEKYQEKAQKYSNMISECFENSHLRKAVIRTTIVGFSPGTLKVHFHTYIDENSDFSMIPRSEGQTLKSLLIGHIRDILMNRRTCDNELEEMLRIDNITFEGEPVGRQDNRSGSVAVRAIGTKAGPIASGASEHGGAGYDGSNSYGNQTGGFLAITQADVDKYDKLIDQSLSHMYEELNNTSTDELIERRKKELTGYPIVIAVLDTGIWTKHPKLIDMVVHTASAIASEDIEPALTDELNHGTASAGLVWKYAGKHLGKTLVKVLNIRIFKSKQSDEEFISALRKGLEKVKEWEKDNYRKVDIVLTSIGIGKSFPCGPNCKTLNDELFEFCKERIIVAAAGNDGQPRGGPDNTGYPASSDHVLGVGSLNEKGHLDLFSAQGEGLDFLAPGNKVVTTSRKAKPEEKGIYSIGNQEGNYWRQATGTSFAAPNFAAILAVLLGYIHATLGADMRKELTKTITMKHLLKKVGDQKTTAEGRGWPKFDALNHIYIQQIYENFQI